MRAKLIILFFALCPVVLSGQSAEESVIRLKKEMGEPTVDFNDEDGLQGRWNLNVGTSFSYFKGFGSGMMLYAAPVYTLPLNQRWALHGGLIASQYQVFNTASSGENMLPTSFSGMALFVSASYQMNDRLILHGTGTRQLLSAPEPPFSPYTGNNLSLGATYRLGDNMTIGATIHMNQGSGAYSMPYNGSMFQSPFYW